MRILSVIPMNVPSWKHNTMSPMWNPSEKHGCVYVFYKHGCVLAIELNEDEINQLNSSDHDTTMNQVRQALEDYVMLVKAVKRTVPNVDESDDTPMPLFKE